MKPLDQTKFVGAVPSDNPEDAGNCMQAAFASLLELTLDDVPHFAAMADDEWWGAVLAWGRSRGYAVVTSDESINGVLGICTGQSPRGDFKHVVITRGDEVVHDPHPSRAGVLTQERWWYLLALDPVRVPVGPAVAEGGPE